MSTWINAVEDYLSRQTDYALMIEGEWGSGKTYAFKNNVLPKILELEMKPIYVSLFGISSVDQLSRALLSSTWLPEKAQEMIESKIGKTVSEIGKVLISAAAGTQLMNWVKPPKLDVNFENFLYLKSKTVLCFDDVERCKIKGSELLGFINRFLEHDNLKVIFIANSKKIEDSEFKEMKEKLVRLTLKFDPNLDELIPEIINNATLEWQLIQTKLLTVHSDVIRFCSQSEVSNVRTLKYAIDLFVNAMSKIDQKDIDKMVLHHEAC